MSVTPDEKQGSTHALLRERLRSAGISPTAQRLRIAELVLLEPDHFCADQVFERVSLTGGGVSRATVYNALSLFVEKGLLAEVIVDPGKLFYDSTLTPHHHVYDVDTGQLFDVDAARVTVSGLPPLPKDKEMVDIDVIVRIRGK